MILSGADLDTAREAVRDAILRVVTDGLYEGRLLECLDSVALLAGLVLVIDEPHNPRTESRPLPPEHVSALADVARGVLELVENTARDREWFDKLKPTERWYARERERGERLRSLLGTLEASTEPAT